MVKFVAGVFLLLTSFMLPGQVEWAPVGATWHYTYFNYPEAIEYLKLESVRDTVMGGVDASVLTQTVFREDGEVDNFLGNLYIYQDGFRIYLWIRGRFELLYDLDAEVGDTLRLIAPQETFRPEGDSVLYLRVDSVRTFEIDGQILKGQFVYPIFDGAAGFAVQFSGWNIEGAGNQMYFHAWNQLDCDGECPDMLRCYSHNSALFYKAVDYPCDSLKTTVVSTTGFEMKKHDLIVYTNPIYAGAQLNFSLASSGQDVGNLSRGSYEVVDFQGRQIVPLTKMTSSHESISTIGITPGVYILRVRSERGMASKRVIIY